MFERFTEGAIKVIMMSQEEAKRMGHSFVGTEQILLGLIGQRYGIASKVLQKLEVSLKEARIEIELYIGRGNGFVASEIPFTPRAKRVLEMSVQEGKELGQNFVGTEHILLALIGESDGVAMRTLDKMNVDISRIRMLVYEYIEERQEKTVRTITPAEKLLLEREKKNPTPTLDEYSENITKAALENKLDPVIGREKEINDLIAVLARRTKNNPVLLGEPGVGKTAVAEGLAQLMLTEEVPDFLAGSLIMQLDLGSILAGTKYRGEFEERLKKIVEEAQNDPSIIIFIDEIHTLVGAGAAEGAVDAANILKPALARGKFRCIGATTKDEYRKYIERDPALERRFQPVYVEEPSVGITIEILKGLKPKFEQHHGLTYDYKALEQASILSGKYVADRFLPDKAIDVLDEAGSRVRLANSRMPEALKHLLEKLKQILKDKEVAVKTAHFIEAQQVLDREMEIRSHIRIMKASVLTSEARGFTPQEVERVMENDVAAVVANWTGIPVTKITGSESARLLKMEATIHERIIGQKHAVTSVSKAIRRSRVGLRNPNRPIASFIFAGPTGVGKTELTKALSDYMFGNEDKNLIRLDMSEYMEKHTVAKLIGSPPGYVGYNEGGQLTESVRLKPYSVVLFDEVEKAHPDVFNLLLQILDDGRLTDSQGRLIDFTNTLIIMTTNLGSKIIERESGIEPKSERGEESIRTKPDPIYGWEPAPDPIQDEAIFEHVCELVNDELKNFFRPEFLNRIDEIIIFKHLTRVNIWQICSLMVDQLKNRIKEKELTLIVDSSVQAFLSDEGYDPIYGARPLRRAVMRYLEDKLAEECLSKTLYPGTKIIVSRKKNEKLDSTYSETYTNELEVEIDFSDVDPDLLKSTEEKLDEESKRIKRLAKRSKKKKKYSETPDEMKQQFVNESDTFNASIRDKPSKLKTNTVGDKEFMEFMEEIDSMDMKKSDSMDMKKSESMDMEKSESMDMEKSESMDMEKSESSKINVGNIITRGIRKLIGLVFIRNKKDND